MFPLNAPVLRFSLTYGLLLLIIIPLVTVFHQPVKKYIEATRQYTSAVSKSQVLGYQTPDFQLLARNILNQYKFTPDDMETYDNGEHYLSFYTKGAELFPDSFEMHYMMGVCYLWRNDPVHAAGALHQALQQNPVFFWSYYNLGLMSLKYGRVDNAIAFLTMARQVPAALTEKALNEEQAFSIIWRYMPNPQAYLVGHLQQGYAQAAELLKLAAAIKNNPQKASGVNWDQWPPVFF